MEAESCNKELIHRSKKKLKGNNENSMVFENIANKTHQESDNEEKRKSKSKKRKKEENENHEKKNYDESHKIKIPKEFDRDVKKIRLHCGDNVKKIKSKKKLKENFDKRCSYENKKQINNNVPNFKQPEIFKKKKKKNVIEKLNVEHCYEKEKDYHYMKYKNCKKNKEHKKDIENSNTVKKIKHKNKHIKDNFDKICTYENKKTIENTVPNFKQPEVLKKKKKKKKSIIEKLNVEDCDEKGKDYDVMKYKKCKKNKVFKKNMENSNSEIRIGNENLEDCIQDESAVLTETKKRNIIEKLNVEGCDEKGKEYDDMKYKKCKKKKVCKKNKENSNSEIRIVNENHEDCIQNESTLPTETNTEIINSLYSHEYANDPNRFNSRNDISESVKKKRTKLQMYDDFIYKLPGDIEMLKIPEKESLWGKHSSKYGVVDYPQESIQKDLLERVEYIADYFDRFANDDLTEEECQEKELSNFKGPYLPTPQHIKFFGDLNIELDWEIPAEQQLLFSYSSYTLEKKNGVILLKYTFLRSEDTIILENWQKFQEQFKFYDLRPLIGFRTMKVNHEGGCFTFEEVDYVDPNERYKFLLYMARGLEKRTRYQVWRRITQIATKIEDNEISYRNSRFEPRELAEIEAFIKLFGTHYRAMEFILGKVNHSRYLFCSFMHIKYKNMPIRTGPWQSTEQSRLVRSIFRATNASSIEEILISKVPWKEVFPTMQTRHIYLCRAFFNKRMKWRLEMASNLSNQETDSTKIYWTSNDMVKLIMLVSENLGPTINKINWEEVGSHFEIFGPNSCEYRFRMLYYKRVPRNKQLNIKEAVEYLLTYVVPNLENGSMMVERGSYTLDELRSLPLNNDHSAKSSNKWSLKNTIKLIKEVYENAGSSVETTNWSEISSHFKKYDERNCRNHFRFLYYNRVPHQHRTSFDSALEYLKNRICPMLEQKKQRNRRESLLTQEVVNLSPEDHLIFQALLNDISQADDDEDIAMLQEENNEQLIGQNSQSTSTDCHAISATQKYYWINELDYYKQEKQEDEIDGDLEYIAEHKVDSYLDELDREENKNINLHLSSEGEITRRSLLHDDVEYNSNEDSEADESESETSDGEEKEIMEKKL